METTDRLCIIPPSEWTELRDLYRQNWPEHRLAYDTIDIRIKWYKEDRNRKLTIFCLNGSWREDGTYLIVAYKLFIYSLDPTNCVLEKALHLLDWSGGFERVVSFLSRHREPVLKVMIAKGLEKEYDSESIAYYLPKAECDALELELYVPEGYELRSHSYEDLVKATQSWRKSHQDSIFFVDRVRCFNFNVGLYECSTGKLVAWCFEIGGGYGAFRLDSEYLWEVHGTAVAIAVAKRAASLLQDCGAFVNRNEPWKRMLERIGFKDEGTSNWHRNPALPFKRKD